MFPGNSFPINQIVYVVPGSCILLEVPIRFGIFDVDAESGELRRQGARIRLPEQPFQALLALLERPGQVLTREELQNRLWPSGTNVDFDRGLNKAINRVREALGDDAENPRFIETLPQRGYRFIGHVEQPAGAVDRGPPPVAKAPQRLWSRKQWLAAAGIGTAAAIPLVLAGRYGLGRVDPGSIESIAVLPLENLSGDAEEEYFSDGLTDELIGEIARIGSLRVISRTSIMQYKKGPRKSLRAIAQELDVDAIVEGTVVRSQGKVRITAQLIRARDDRHLWSEKYERELTDVLALQAEVAHAIVMQIKAKLTPLSPAAMAYRERPVNPEAHEAFLRGDYFLHRGIRTIPKSVEAFNRAIGLDPKLAEAHVGLGQALCYMGIFGFRPSAETHPEARRAAQKALELDESNAGAHNVLADVLKGFDWNLPAAEVEYKRALELNPSHLLTRAWYADWFTRLGRFDEAMAESARAVALDPVSPLSHSGRAMILWTAHRFDEAVQEAQRALELDPNFVNAYWWMGLAYAHRGEFPKAIESLSRGLAMSDGAVFRGSLGYAYALAGQKAQALGLLGEIEKISKSRYVSPVDYAVAYAGLGDADSVFHWMEEAYRTRATRVHELRIRISTDLRPIRAMRTCCGVPDW